jgi:hypothetical protein
MEDWIKELWVKEKIKKMRGCPSHAAYQEEQEEQEKDD